MKLSDYLASFFLSDEDGSATILSLYFCIILLVLGGLAIDFQKRQADNQRLQNAADSSAHAALLARQTKSATDARAEGLAVLNKMLPRTNMDTAVRSADFTFGTWDFDKRTFVSSPVATEAVHVYAGMTQDRGNPTLNFILSIIGFDSFDVASEAIYAMKLKPCSYQGLLAQGPLTVDSQNFYGPGFCMHSNQYVSLRSNNYFTPDNYDANIMGAKVSMPHAEDLRLPDSGFATNANLDNARTEGWYDFSSLSQIPTIIDELKTGTSAFTPSTVTEVAEDTISVMEIRPEDITSGKAYKHSCSGGTITFKSGTYENFSMVTDCKIEFSSNVVLEDATIATTNTSAQSVYSHSGLQMGKDDDCAPGGEASIISKGGFYANANFSSYGGTVWTEGDIYFHARAQKIEGITMKSLGSITGTSEAEMRVCDTTPIWEEYAEYGPRLVR